MSTDSSLRDAADPLAAFRDRFVDAPGVLAYLDGNSLGRPLTASAERVARFAREEWGGRLIRGWDEGWMDLPVTLGDALGAAALGAAPGQVVIADSTTVILYKLIRAALSARGDRTEIIADHGNFPSDRYLLQTLAVERGLTVRWIEAPADGGVSVADVEAVIGDRTALVVLSSVAFRSGFLADVDAITRLAHDAGALTLWDLCHSAGVVPTPLDELGVDLAAGCGYKYLNGGPGAPAFAYVRAELQAEIAQPITGWIGSDQPFLMSRDFVPATGIRSFLSGTPPVLAMQPLIDSVALIAEAGLPAIRAKSIALTDFAIEVADELVPEARLASPRDSAERGGHITLDHPRFSELVPGLWRDGIIPDFRRPDGIRIGCSPLSTSFAEVETGIAAIARALG